MDVHSDWKEFIGLLNSNQVEYLIVGAFALAAHGLPRMTGDIDFWVNPTEENAKKLANVLNEFGFAATANQAHRFAIPNQLLQLGHPAFRFDLITSIDAVISDEAWQNRLAGELGGMPVNFIGRHEFMKNKIASARDKDLSDVRQLKAFHEEVELNRESD